MLSYVITHRGKERLDNLKYLIKHISAIPSIEIILVEQDTENHLLETDDFNHCKYAFGWNPGLFNKSWGFNIGFKYASYDLICFGDSDVIVPIQSLIEAVSVSRDCPVISPHQEVLALTKKETFLLREYKDLKPEQVSIKQQRINATYAGCSLLLTKNAFTRIGGWDEEFRGWGGEDSAMARYIVPFFLGLDKKQIKRNSYRAFHLWHEQGMNSKKKNPNYEKNCKRLKGYRNQIKKGLLKRNDFDKIGQKDKYYFE